MKSRAEFSRRWCFVRGMRRFWPLWRKGFKNQRLYECGRVRCPIVYGTTHLIRYASNAFIFCSHAMLNLCCWCILVHRSRVDACRKALRRRFRTSTTPYLWSKCEQWEEQILVSSAILITNKLKTGLYFQKVKVPYFGRFSIFFKIYE